MKSYVTAALAILILAGCSNETKESDYKFGGESGAKVTFSAVIDDQNASALGRVTELSWEDGDIIGITCGLRQLNVQYQYSNTVGNYFNSVDRTQEIWLMGNEEYAISAYYPYTGSAGVIPAPLAVETSSENQATKNDRQKIDFLYASGTANRETPNVKLNFTHVMSRIVLTFKADANVTLSDISCYITGFKVLGTFNPATGRTTVDEDAKIESVYQLLNDDNHHIMTAIFLPQKMTDKELLIEAGMNGVYYKVAIPAADIPELKPGYSYNYTITAQNYSDEPIRLIITGTQITPWTNSDGGSFLPDPDLAGTDTDITAPDWGDIENEVVTPTEKK